MMTQLTRAPLTKTLGSRVWHRIPSEAVDHWQPPSSCVMTGRSAQLRTMRCSYTKPGASTIEHQLPLTVAAQTRQRAWAIDAAAVVLVAVAVALQLSVPLLILIASSLLVGAFRSHLVSRPRIKSRTDGLWVRVPAVGVAALDEAVVGALRAHHGLVRTAPLHGAPAPAGVAQASPAGAARPRRLLGPRKAESVEHRAVAYFPITRTALGNLDAGDYAQAGTAMGDLHPDEQLAVLWQADPDRTASWPVDVGPVGLGALAQGVGRIKHGWEIRGTGPVSAVPRETLERFWSQLRSAEEMLYEAQRQAPASPLPLAVLLTSGRGLEIPSRELRTRAERSMALYPTFAAASALMVGIGPMSGGKPEDSYGFLNAIFESTERGHPTRGAVAFAARECVHAQQMTTPCRALFGRLVSDLLTSPPPCNGVELEILAEAAYVAVRINEPRAAELFERLEGRWCGTWKHIADPTALLRPTDTTKPVRTSTQQKVAP